jgi:predicted Zn-dependent protease
MNHLQKESVRTFIRSAEDVLKSLMKQGVIEGFACTSFLREVHTASLFNGEMHSKAPVQVNTPFEIQVSVVLQQKKGVGFSVGAVSLPLFSKMLDFAVSQAVNLQHRIKFRRQENYPNFKLASDQLLQLFRSGVDSAVLLKVLANLESHAAGVNHPRMMNRETTVSLSSCEKTYFDSAGNFAQEISAACSAACSFSLEDTTESHSDVFGSLPDDGDLRALVDEAAKNLVISKVQPLGTDAQLPVLLTHKAVIDLFDQLVMPNLDTRTLIDKTGAWELEHVGQVVLQRLSIEDNPHLERSPFSAFFDFEGTPTRPIKILDDGRLLHPLMTSALLEEIEDIRPEWKGRFALTGHAESTNSASFTNVIYKLNCPPIETNAIRSYIQIQNLTGMSLDPLTGQFALDAEGAKVFVDGKLKYSTSLTLRGNFFQALADESTRAGAIGRHYNQWAPSLYTGALNCVSKELAHNFEDKQS